jgi:UDP-glucose 4-epimerase
MKDTFILIGGNGFIGSWMRATLAAAGHEVIVVGRSASTDHGHVYFSTIAMLEAYIATQPQGNSYVVIDLAYTSVPNTSYDNPVKDFSENLYNVIQHLDFALRIAARKFVYISSGGTVYGNVLMSPVHEQCENFPLSPYGITKMACERYVNLYHHTHGLNINIVRPANIYGPGQKPFRGQGFVSTAYGLAYKNEPVSIFGDGGHVRDYLYVADFCKAVMALIEKGEEGAIYNIGSGEGLSINQVVQAINHTLEEEQIELKCAYKPSRLFDVATNVLDSGKLMSVTGWAPETSFKEGLLITKKWIKQYIANNH